MIIEKNLSFRATRLTWIIRCPILGDRYPHTLCAWKEADDDCSCSQFCLVEPRRRPELVILLAPAGQALTLSSRSISIFHRAGGTLRARRLANT
jgi:hypothetical protein